MANVSYDTLTIEINADSKQANSSIKSLSNNLQKLDKVVNSLDVQSIQNTQKLLQNIANIDFSNVSQGLREVVDAFRALDKMKGKAPKGTDPKEQVKAIGLMTKGGNGWEKPTLNLPQFDYSKINLDNIFGKRQTEEIQRMTGDFGKLEVQLQQTKDAMKATAKASKEAEKQFKKSTGTIQKWVNALKRIAFYRIVRRVIHEIGKSLGEAVQELAKFDSNFNQSISQLKSSFSYLGRSIMAMLAPIINILAPIISTITNQVGQLANQVGQAFSGDTFSQAEQSVEDYAESLKKAQNATLGIDELNVIQEDEDKTLFSEQSGAQFGGLTDTFKDVMDFVGTINASLTQFMTKILPAIKKVLDPILEIVSMIVDLINVLVENTFDSVNNSLVSFVEMIGSIIGFIARLVENLMPTLVPIIQIVGSVINIINNALGKIFQSVGSVFEMLAPMLDLIRLISIPLGFILQLVNTIAIIVDAIIKTVIDLITLNWGNIGNDWVNVSSDIQQSWEQWAQTLDGNVDISGSYSTPSASGENANVLSGNGGSQGASVGTAEVNVYLDSEQIAKKVEQRVDRRGFQTTFGGYKYNG